MSMTHIKSRKNVVIFVYKKTVLSQLVSSVIQTHTQSDTVPIVPISTASTQQRSKLKFKREESTDSSCPLYPLVYENICEKCQY